MRSKNNILKLINIFLKLTLIISFLIVFILNTPYLQSKGMIFRAPFFIGVLFIIPLISYFKKWKNYPHLADSFITMPFLLDTLGNIFGLFDSIILYDDILHVVNWIFLIMAYHLIRFTKVFDKRDALLLGTGIGVISIVLWEILEWVLSVDGFGTLKGLKLSYNDTIGDLLTSSIGSILGSILGLQFFNSSRNSQK